MQLNLLKLPKFFKNEMKYLADQKIKDFENLLSTTKSSLTNEIQEKNSLSYNSNSNFKSKLISQNLPRETLEKLFSTENKSKNDFISKNIPKEFIKK